MIRKKKIKIELGPKMYQLFILPSKLVETRASHGEMHIKLMCNKFSVKCEKNSEFPNARFLHVYYRSLHINNFTQRLTQRLQTHTHTHTHTGRVFILCDIFAM